MALKLTLGGGPNGGPQTKMLSGGTISLGRGPGNDWVLPDPQRFLSKTHCVIEVRHGRYILTDLSTNGVHINGAQQPTSRDSQTMLTDGDEFRLGPYVVTVAEVRDAAADRFGAAGPAGTREPAGERSGPLDVDPLDDPLGRPPDPDFRHPLGGGSASLGGEDAFDREDERRRRVVDPHEDLYRGVVQPGSWKGPSQSDHVDAPQQAFAPPRVVGQSKPDEIDFEALIGDLESLLTPPSSSPAAPDPAPKPAVTAPRAREPAADAPARVVPPADPASAPAAAAAGLLAFLDGAGVPGLASADGDPEAALRAAGKLFRAMTGGLRELLMSRAAIKGEMRIEQTMIRARDNNALKFCASADEAVTALLGRERPGYVPALTAVREGFDDVKSHELAVMVGVQTALVALLRRINPDALETRITQRLLGNLVPAARKARYWDGYRQLYGEIAREAGDDFQAVFGRAFAKAYAAETRKD